MAQLLINVVFSIVNFFASAFLNPILLAMQSIFPDLSQMLTGFNTYVGYGLTYFTFFTKLLMIPNTLMIFLFTVPIACFTVATAIRLYALSMTIFQFFKP